MNYGEVLKSSFAIAWRNRYLWFFGLFAGGAGLNFPSGNFDFDTPGDRGAAPGAVDLPELDPGLIVAIVLVVLVLLVVALALYIVSQGALVESVAAIDRGGQRRFGTAWKAGTRTFWRVLGWWALLVVIAIAILLVVGLPLAGLGFGVFAATEATGARIAVAVVIALVALAALIMLVIPLGIIGQLSVRELVLREERPVASIRRGYRMFRSHLGPTLLMWLILVGITLGGALALVLALIVIGIVLALPAIGLAIAELTAAAIVAGVIAGAILLALFLVSFGALGAFTHAAWTLAYLRLGRSPDAPTA